MCGKKVGKTGVHIIKSCRFSRVCVLFAVLVEHNREEEYSSVWCAASEFGAQNRRWPRYVLDSRTTTTSRRSWASKWQDDEDNNHGQHIAQKAHDKGWRLRLEKGRNLHLELFRPTDQLFNYRPTTFFTFLFRVVLLSKRPSCSPLCCLFVVMDVWQAFATRLWKISFTFTPTHPFFRHK